MSLPPNPEPDSRPTAPAAVATRGLTRRFGEVQAVADVALTIARGEMFGLVGPDGAGKSTLIRLLCGILPPTAGSAELLGLDLATHPAAVKARIGYLSQAFTLYGDLTVDENIEFFADLHGVRDAASRRNALLEFTRLTPFRSRLAAALSGGMKKKLALACTLIHTPDIIFLDEPSTGVDPVSRGEFWSILSRILAQGVTIVMTTPYLDEAERCTRIAFMHRGAIIRVGTPDEIKAAMPGRLYSVQCAALQAAYHALKQRWAAAQIVRYGDRLHFRTVHGDAEQAEAAAWLASHGLPDCRFAPVTPSLEDVFVAEMSATSPAAPAPDTPLREEGRR